MYTETVEMFKEFYGWEESFKVYRDDFRSIRSTFTFVI